MSDPINSNPGNFNPGTSDTESSSSPSLPHPRIIDEVPMAPATSPLAETAASALPPESTNSVPSSGIGASADGEPPRASHSASVPPSGAGDPPPPPPPQAPSHPPFPWSRLFYSIFFGVVAYFVFLAILLLALLQFITVAITGHVNEELKNITHSMVRYLAEAMAYIVLAREELPFPFQPHPHD